MGLFGRVVSSNVRPTEFGNSNQQASRMVGLAGLDATLQRIDSFVDRLLFEGVVTYLRSIT